MTGLGCNEGDNMSTSDFKIIAVGSNEVLAKEIADAVTLILGERILIDTCLAENLKTDLAGDLFVCNRSQVNTLLKIIPVDKIIILNLTPTTQFFVDMAKIPEGETVHVFNNRLPYALQLIDLCTEMHIKHVQFIPIAYEEMEESQITSLLGEARYIVGVDKLLGEEVLFSDKYKDCLRTDITVIGAKRVAAIQSACALVKWVFLRMQKDISSRVWFLTENLNKTMQTPGIANHEEKLNEMADELKELASESGKIAETMQNTILQSIMAQFNAKQDTEANLSQADGTMQDVQTLLGKLKEFS